MKWQLKRTSKPWNCEICDSKIQWPANQTLQLVELLSELKTEETPPPPAPQPRSSRTQRQVVITSRVERRQSPGKWRLLQQAMSTRCLLAAQSLRTSIFLSRQRGSSSSTVVDWKNMNEKYPFWLFCYYLSIFLSFLILAVVIYKWIVQTEIVL